MNSRSQMRRLASQAPDTLIREIENLRRELKSARDILVKVKAHGCCVMHNDESCPGCAADAAVKRIDDSKLLEGK